MIVVISIVSAAWQTYVQFSLGQVYGEISRLKLDEIRSSLVGAIENPTILLQSVQSYDSTGGLDLVRCLKDPTYSCRPTSGTTEFEFPLVLDNGSRWLFNPATLPNSKKFGVSLAPNQCTETLCDSMIGKENLCSGFDATSPIGACNFRFVVVWSPMCPALGTCSRPQIILKIKVEKSAGSTVNLGWLSPERYEIHRVLF